MHGAASHLRQLDDGVWARRTFEHRPYGQLGNVFQATGLLVFHASRALRLSRTFACLHAIKPDAVLRKPGRNWRLMFIEADSGTRDFQIFAIFRAANQ